MVRNIKHRYQRITYVTESRVSSYRSEVVTALAWTKQIKCRGLSEQPNHIRVATVIQQKTPYGNNLDKCEQQQSSLGTVSYK